MDDDAGLREGLAELLTFEGYEVGMGANAEEGLRFLAAEKFSLVVSDYVMPGRSGVWMLQEAASRGLLQETRVLLFTGESHPKGAEALKVLHKPTDSDLFLREIFNALAPARMRELERAQAFHTV